MKVIFDSLLLVFTSECVFTEVGGRYPHRYGSFSSTAAEIAPEAAALLQSGLKRLARSVSRLHREAP